MATTDYNREVLQPLVAAWLGKVQEAIRAKARFKDTADQCMAFFSGSVGFMWETDFLRKYVGEMLKPRFKITVAKAFELVALFGPTLYWRNPTRLVKPRKKLEIDPAVFGGLDPSGWQLYQMFQQQSQQQGAVDEAVSQLLEMYLNYTPAEQPGGGLATHSSDAITEALVKGRGCIWPRPYFMPGSERVLTGCFYDTVDNLLIDPDAQSLSDAKFIIQRCIQPTYEVERQFQLPEGSLKGKGSHESGDAQGRSASDAWAAVDRRSGKSFDLLTYYKIWSKAGCGGRLSGAARMEDDLGRALDQVVGDYAYIVVAPGVPFPLNVHSALVRSGGDEEIGRRFRWPVPYWLDDRWPVCILDFYRHPNSVWPIAPMAPGLGELAYLNILISQLANHVWTSSRTMFAAPDHLDQHVRAAIEGGADFSYIPYRFSGSQNRLQDVLGYIQAPQLNPDAWRIYEMVSGQFDRRVGLSELLYSLNPGGVQQRSAEESSIKKEMASIRPDYMAGKVEDWQTELADMEKLCCRWFVEAPDTAGFFGQVEQMLWDRYVVHEQPEYIVRELRATTAANSTRKPDKQRDTQNMQQLLNSPLLTIFDQYMQTTGDVQPINALLKQWGKTIDQDLSEMYLQPLNQSEDPEAQQAAVEQQIQLEQHGQQMGQSDQQHQMQLAQNQQQMAIAAQQHQQKLQHGQLKMHLDHQKAQTAQQVAKQKAKQRPKARAA